MEPAKFYWLLLKSGEVVVGTKGSLNRVSWETLDAEGYQSAVNDSSVVSTIPLKTPTVKQTKREVTEYNWE